MQIRGGFSSTFWDGVGEGDAMKQNSVKESVFSLNKATH